MTVTASEFSQLPALIGVEQACALLGISRSAGYRAADQAYGVAVLVATDPVASDPRRHVLVDLGLGPPCEVEQRGTTGAHRCGVIYDSEVQ